MALRRHISRPVVAAVSISLPISLSTSLSSHSAELETLFSFEQQSLDSVQCSRLCCRHSCPSLSCLLFSVANFPFALRLLLSSSRSPRLTRSRVPSQLGDRIFGTGNSHFCGRWTDGCCGTAVFWETAGFSSHGSVHFDGSSACGDRQTQDTVHESISSGVEGEFILRRTSVDFTAPPHSDFPSLRSFASRNSSSSLWLLFAIECVIACLKLRALGSPAQHDMLLVAVDSPCLAVVIEVSWSPKRVVVDVLHVKFLALLRACAAQLSVDRFC